MRNTAKPKQPIYALILISLFVCFFVVFSIILSSLYANWAAAWLICNFFSIILSSLYANWAAPREPFLFLILLWNNCLTAGAVELLLLMLLSLSRSN